MGVGFNWFKDYKIIEQVDNVGWFQYVEYKIEYLDYDKTSHSYGNRSKLQDIFNSYLGIQIPTIMSYYSDIPELNLIKPKTMYDYCNKLLSDCSYDLEGMEDRIKWIKELSDKGYYVSYDMT